MGTTNDFIEFVCEQIPNNFNIKYRKMFDEYMVYLNDKPILLVCDNIVYVKILPQIEEFMINADKGFPYKTAKEYYILDIEDNKLIENVLPILENITPPPKKKK